MPERSPSEPFFSVVVLNWNTLELLKRNLAALKAQSYPSLEVIVVDNGSEDGSAEWLKGAEFAAFGFKLVALPENTGFAAGMNEGLRRASGDWLLPLNVDVFLAPDFFAKAAEKIKADPSVTMIGPLIYRYDKENGPTEEVLCTYVAPTRFLSLATVASPRRAAARRSLEKRKWKRRSSRLIFRRAGRRNTTTSAISLTAKTSIFISG